MTRYVVGFMCVLALGVVGCSEDGGGEPGECADWAGDWTLSSMSCDGVVQPGFDSGIELSLAANCTGETVLMISETCEEIIQMTFTSGVGDTTIVDNGATACSAGCSSQECEATADAAQPYTATISVSDNAWTATALTTAQMVSDEFTPCEVGQTMVSVAVPR